MSWEAVARKDFRDAIRSYWLWGLSALFTLIAVLPPALVLLDVIQLRQQGQGPGITTDIYIQLMQGLMTLLVPVIAIVVAYAALAGERDSGTLKLLLALPHSRLDVVIGKVVGRVGVVVLPVLGGLLVTLVLFFLTPVTVAFGTFVQFALLTALLGAVFAAIAVGISAAARTGRRAVVGVVAVFALFSLLWSRSVNGLLRLLQDNVGLETGTRVRLHLFLEVLNPTNAYSSLVTTLNTPAEVQVGNSTVPGSLVARTQLVGGAGLQGQLRQQVYLQSLGDSLPFYLSDPFLLVLLLGWVVLAPLVGYSVFREADL